MKTPPPTAAQIDKASLAAWRDGNPVRAMTLCAQGLRLDPANDAMKARYAHFVEQLKTDAFDPDIKKTLTLCLKCPVLEHQKLAGMWWSTLRAAPLYAFLFDAGSDGLKYWRSIDALLNDEFFILGLKKLNPVNAAVEQALIRLRKTLLLAAGDEGRLRAKHLPLLCALAIQNFYNEYVWSLDDDETAHVAALYPRDPLTIALAGAYRPLLSYDGAAQWPDMHAAGPLADVLKIHVLEPLEEKNLRQRIAQFSPITPGTSQDVQAMYEENPYPRWSGIDRPARTYDDVRVDMLTAGCGTGRPLTQFATSFPNARITAIDLSGASLAYALRRTRAAGVSNIEFAQGDILNIADVGKQFDFIESSGVLHHMKDPEAGWKALLTRLRPGGRMQVALYSKTARRTITQVRDYIKENAYPADLPGIRRLRRDLMALPDGHALKPVTLRRDFFSTSECRDLVFHVQEHVYTLPDIAALLDRLGLAFLGFQTSPAMRALYDRHFPADPARRNLENWHRLEQENPSLFIQMYVIFVCRKGEIESPPPEWIILEKTGVLSSR